MEQQRRRSLLWQGVRWQQPLRAAPALAADDQLSEDQLLPPRCCCASARAERQMTGRQPAARTTMMEEDARTLAVMYDGSGARRRTFAEAVNAMQDLNLPGGAGSLRGFDAAGRVEVGPALARGGHDLRLM